MRYPPPGAHATAVGIVLLLMLAPAASLADPGEAILGLWSTEADGPNTAHVEIFHEADLYHGRIVWVAEPDFPADDPEGMAGQPKVDRRNPDPKLRGAPIVGLLIVEGFRYVGGRSWKDGRIYDPKNGKTYRCKMKLVDNDTLHVRGFVGISLLGRTTIWTRP